MRKLKGLLFLGAGLLVGLVLGAAILLSAPLTLAAGKPPPPSTGKPVSDFKTTTLDGRNLRLRDLRGQPVVLNFWATWCPPCRAEMPLLNQTATLLGQKVHFLAIDDDEDGQVVRDFLKTWAITLPVLLDPGGKINALFYIESYPITFFLDSEGILRAEHIGQLDEASLFRNLEAVGIRP